MLAAVTVTPATRGPQPLRTIVPVPVTPAAVAVVTPEVVGTRVEETVVEEGIDGKMMHPSHTCSSTKTCSICFPIDVGNAMPHQRQIAGGGHSDSQGFPCNTETCIQTHAFIHRRRDADAHIPPSLSPFFALRPHTNTQQTHARTSPHTSHRHSIMLPPWMCLGSRLLFPASFLS